MSTPSRGRGLLVSTLVLGLLFALGPPAEAKKKPPPEIEQLLGAWKVKFKGKAVDTFEGIKLKHKEVADWTVTSVNENTVLLEGFGCGPLADFYARYINGQLVIGFAFAGGGYGRAGYAKVKGKPGKLKLKGNFILADSYTGRLEWTRFKGKQIEAAGGD